MYIYIYTYICMYVYAHIYMEIYIHMNTYTYTYMNRVARCIYTKKNRFKSIVTAQCITTRRQNPTKSCRILALFCYDGLLPPLSFARPGCRSEYMCIIYTHMYITLCPKQAVYIYIHTYTHTYILPDKHTCPSP